MTAVDAYSQERGGSPLEQMGWALEVSEQAHDKMYNGISKCMQKIYHIHAESVE